MKVEIMMLCTTSLCRSLRYKVSPPSAFIKGKVTNRLERCFVTMASGMNDDSKVYLHVPFEEKDDVKRVGGRWDPGAKKWYIPSLHPQAGFEHWKVCYLNVPFAEKEEAKAKGAMWDNNAQKWFVNQGRAEQFSQWIATDELSSDNLVNDTHSSVDGEGKEVSYVKLMGDGVLFFDIETNGLPARTEHGYAPYSDFGAYSSSRIVQLGCMLCERSTLNILDQQEIIIQADEFPIENSQFHGITLERSLAEGTYFPIAVQKMLPLIRRAKYMVAHNAEFDTVIFKSELSRYRLSSALEQVESMQPYCTMYQTKALLGLKDKNGNLKNPSLKELYSYATGKELHSHHDAKHDVLHLHEAIKELVARGDLKSFE